jgi:small conductance mechanosensitive channel
MAVRALDDKRGGTLVPITRSLVRGLAFGVGVVMALDHVGVDVRAIIAGAGIVGIAIGFGAQSLVRDLISGFFLLMEDVVRVGDVATVGTTTGTIEQVGLRMIQLRAQNGQLWFIPNGEIKEVGNFNRGWTRAVVDVGTAYEADVAKAIQVLQSVGEAYANEHPHLVLDRPEAQGVIAFNSSDLTLRLMLKVMPNALWGVERELRTRIKAAFERDGIEIPYPRQVTILPTSPAGEGPAQ